MALYSVSSIRYTLLSSHGSREKGWKSSSTPPFRVSNTSFDLKTWPLGDMCIVLYLSNGKEGQSALSAEEETVVARIPSDAHRALVEKLWDEVGTLCIVQIGTYINPRPLVVGQIGGICLSIISVDVSLHLCLQIKKACIRLLRQ